MTVKKTQTGLMTDLGIGKYDPILLVLGNGPEDEARFEEERASVITNNVGRRIVKVMAFMQYRFLPLAYQMALLRGPAGGHYQLRIKNASMESGVDSESLKTLLRELENECFIPLGVEPAGKGLNIKFFDEWMEVEQR